ncbi:MAG: GyrI-like domain-containing protein [Planctomycetes bacterium]|nr:GyrI-like domain-containing protein [Planctomycetota bacterium]MBI3843920.1 GyrI-like domain-containing protein [Planctomycetota bacterium]
MNTRTLTTAIAAILLAATPARAQSSDATALLTAIDAARFGPTPRPAAESVVMHGTFTLDIGGFTKDQPMKGTLEVLFEGPNMREISDYGTFGRVECGCNGDLVWEMHVAFGNKIRHGDDAAVMRRLLGFVRWPGWSAMYESAAIVGSERIDGRACDTVRFKPESGLSEVWYVDQETRLPRKIEVSIPSTEKPEDAQIEFFEWQRVDGVAYPKKQRVTMGTAIGDYVYDRVAHGERIDPQRFALPEPISKLVADESSTPKPKEDPGWQVVTREPQPVASVRVRVAKSEVSKTLAEILPEVSAYVSEIGAQTTAAPFCRYHSEADGSVDLEAGIQVTKPVPAKGRIQPSEIPGGRAAIAFNFGPYDKLESARTSLRAWIKEQHLTPRGGVVEIFWSDPGRETNKKEWRTQLVWPVE